MAGGRYDRSLTIKLTLEQARAIKRAARARSLRLSEWMRSVLVTAAELPAARNGGMQLEPPRLP